MRILHLLAERGYSGGEHQLEALLAHLKARGHESIVACQPGARFREVCERLELRVENLRMRNDLDVLAIAAIRKLYKRTSCDLIHWACSRSHKLGALAAARMKNRPPCVVTRRMDYPLPKTRLRRWLYGTAPDAVVAVSEGVRREVLALGVEPARVHLIHDGVDVERLCNLGARRSAAREAFGLDEGCVVGLTTASLHRRKGHDVLIAALGELASSLDEILASRGLTESQGGGDSRRSADRQAGESADSASTRGESASDAAQAVPRLVWLCAGEGPERDALEQAARALPSEIDFRLLGQVDVEMALAAADLFCLPSRREGLGVALLEAIAAGLPAIVSRVGGMPEAIRDGESGWLVEPDDVAALATALRDALTDPDRARQRAERAFESARVRFAITTMCEESEALYSSLADR